MEFQDVVRRRRMIRRYDPDRDLPPEVVDRILHNATRAPSAGFSQGGGSSSWRGRSRSPSSATRAHPRRTPTAGWPPKSRRPWWSCPTPTSPPILTATPRTTRGTRPVRRLVARAVLGHRHRLRFADDAAHRGGRGTRRVLLRYPWRPDRCLQGDLRRAGGVPPDRRDLDRLPRRPGDGGGFPRGGRQAAQVGGHRGPSRIVGPRAMCSIVERLLGTCRAPIPLQAGRDDLLSEDQRVPGLPQTAST